VIPESIIINAIDLNEQVHIRQGYETDPEALEAFKALKHGFAPMKMQLQDWDMFNDLLYYKGKLVIPNDVELRQNLTDKAHNQSGHNGHYGTLNWLQDLYWWPNMT